MRERSESVYATLIIVSAVLVILGVFGLMLGLGGGMMQMTQGKLPSGGSNVVAALGILSLTGGLALFAFLMFSGAAIGATEKRGIRKKDLQTRVLAKYACNARGETLPLEWDFFDPGTKFFVRMELGDGNRVEFQCVKEVFDQCGEGMRGESHYQGRWLGMFRPYIGVQPIVQ